MTDEIASPSETMGAGAPMGETTPSQVETSAESAPAPQGTQEQAPKHDNVQRRIDRLTRDKYRLQAELEQERRARQEFLARQEYESQSHKPPPGAPKIEEFQDFDAYLTAKAEWIAEQKIGQTLSARERQVQAMQAQHAQQAMLQTWNNRLAKTASSIPDFEEVVSAADVQITPVVGHLLMSADTGPALMYYLARNPGEVEKLNSLSPDAAARALGRIEAKMEAETKAKTQSSAPAPINPVSGGGVASTAPSEHDDMKTWIAKRNKQIGRS